MRVHCVKCSPADGYYALARTGRSRVQRPLGRWTAASGWFGLKRVDPIASGMGIHSFVLKAE